MLNPYNRCPLSPITFSDKWCSRGYLGGHPVNGEPQPAVTSSSCVYYVSCLFHRQSQIAAYLGPKTTSGYPFLSSWPEKWSYHIPRPANGWLLEDTLSSSPQFCRNHKKKLVKFLLVLTDEGLVAGVGDMLKSGKEAFFDSFLSALNSGCRKQDNSM